MYTLYVCNFFCYIENVLNLMTFNELWALEPTYRYMKLFVELFISYFGISKIYCSCSYRHLCMCFMSCSTCMHVCVCACECVRLFVHWWIMLNGGQCMCVCIIMYVCMYLGRQ